MFAGRYIVIAIQVPRLGEEIVESLATILITVFICGLAVAGRDLFLTVDLTLRLDVRFDRLGDILFDATLPSQHQFFQRVIIDNGRFCIHVHGLHSAAKEIEKGSENAKPAVKWAS